jgi:hypothetical protein
MSSVIRGQEQATDSKNLGVLIGHIAQKCTEVVCGLAHLARTVALVLDVQSGS